MNLDPLGSLFVALLVLLIGSLLNRKVRVLSRYNVPDPITGGLLFAIIAAIVLATSGFRVEFTQPIKSLLLLMFFAGVGMCADLRELKKGGKALVMFLLVLFPYILVQNGIGIGVAMLLDQHPIFGLVGGSITLVGGHGTGAAYAERFAEINNLQAVMELSMTVATMGLIAGGIIVGPVAQYLIKHHNLRQEGAVAQTVEEAAKSSGEPEIGVVGVVGALAGVLAAVAAGQWLAAHFSGSAITIPSFLWCMMLGVAIRNLLPFARISFDDRASNLISSVCLSLFLVMTMMALDLIQVLLSAGPFIVMVLAQIVGIVLYAVFVCFRLMGGNYEAAVASVGMIGFNMGSTATAMAGMQTITSKYGPAPQAYLIVPLTGAFFIDLMNALVLTLMLTLPFLGG